MSKYTRTITQTINGEDRGCSVTVDVYDVLRAFNVTDPAIQHAIKKLLCTGIRGHKDSRQDLEEAIQSIDRALDVIRSGEVLGKPVNLGEAIQSIDRALDAIRSQEALGEPVNTEGTVVPDVVQQQDCPFSLGDVIEHYDRAYSASKWKITDITSDRLVVVSNDPYRQPSHIERAFWRNYHVAASPAIDNPQTTC